MGEISHAFVVDIINTYFELGSSALERKEYAIALKMFRAVFDEPRSKPEREKIMFSLLMRSGEAHEGLKQLYKAKLFYIRALAQHRKLSLVPDMETVEILLRLSHLTTQQGLFREAVEFALEAQEAYFRCHRRDPVAFVRSLRCTERVLQLKGRRAEQQKVLEILQRVRTEALMTIPGVAGVMPVTLAVPV
jgi:hypothetical protein